MSDPKNDPRTDPISDPVPFPSRPMRVAAAAVRLLSWAAAALLLLFVVAWGTLHFWIVPRIDEFRPRLEVMAGRTLGVPVRIGALQAVPAGMVPWIELREVALLDPAGREALRLPRVQAALSAVSLLNLGFEQLFIESPELDIRRTEDGRVLVAGLDFLSTNDGVATSGADWFFSQREFVIRGGTVRWTDERLGAPTLALGAVDLVIRNRARRHDMRLDATPPPGWGERFVAMGKFRRSLLSLHPGRFSDWTGQVYADFAHIDVSRLRQHARLDVEVAEGRGAVRLWADVNHGQFMGGAADLALTEVTATLGEGLAPLALRRLAGRLGGKRLGEGFEFYTEGLQFHTQEGLNWPGGNLFVSHQPPLEQAPAQGELRADRLDLAALNQIAHRLPLSPATHALLAQHPASGLVETLQARWQGPLSAPENYQARGRVSALVIGAQPAPVPAGQSATEPALGVPGLRGATLDFDFNQAGGRAGLAITNGALDFPGLFEDPLVPLDRLSAEAQWQLQGERIVVSKASLSLANADMAGEFRGNWQTSDPQRSSARSRFPGVLDLQGSLSRANGARVHRYLPLVLPQEARHYVRDAVRAGAASAVAVRIKGDLNDVPFARPAQGEFRFAAKVRDAALAYVPVTLQTPGDKPWPVLTELTGDLLFDRSSLQVTLGRGRVEGLPGLQLGSAQVRIPDLAHATVGVAAELRGPVTHALGFITRSPVGALIGGALDQAQATGDAAYKLRLTLPVAKLAEAKVQGSVTLAGNDVRITPDTPLLAGARAVVSFSDSGFAIVGGQASMFGGELRLEGGSRPVAAGGNEPSVLLKAQGVVTADGLRRADGLRFVPGLLQGASGTAAYSGTLAFRRGRPELLISSDLRGLALTLPPPLAKPAETALPLRFEQALVLPPPGAAAPASGGPAPLRDRLALELGRLAAISYVRDVSGPEPRVLRGAIAVGLGPGETAAMPEQGVTANINLSQVNLDVWNEVLSRGPAHTSEAARGYLPTVLAVRADELILGGRKLHQLVLGGAREGALWRANLDARQLNGYVEYRQSTDAGPGRLHARLARLVIEPAAVTEVETLLDAQPAAIPALDIVVQELDLRGKKLGRLEIEAINRLAAGAREWRLDKLNLIMPEARWLASGRWAAPAVAASPVARGAVERRRMSLDFRLELADSGALLDRLGMKDVIRRGRGQLDGQVAWAGSPLAIDYPSLNGQFHVNVENGQFLKTEPGIAKLLGVLSLQALPRRLILDFRDVFSDGFGFDFVRGDVTIAQGLASTNNLQMKGVNAAVLMDGRADIARETQDIRVIVVPEVDAGTASLLATVINPAVGLGSFLAQWFLRRPLAQATTQEFHIDGTWTDPRVVKVENPPPRPGSPAAPTEPRPGATP